MLPMKHSLRFLALVLISTPLVGCGSEQVGSAPIISDLRLGATELPAGVLGQIPAQVRFEDADADVLEANVTISSVEGSGEVSVATPIVGAAGIGLGEVTVQVSFLPPAAGTYRLELMVRDAEGNDSNMLEATLTAE